MMTDYFNLERFKEEDGRRLLEARMLSPTGKLTPSQRDEIRAALREYKERHRISDKQIAHQIGDLTASVVNEVISGKYAAATLDDHLRSLNDWMEGDAQRRATRSDRKFVETRVARLLLSCAERTTRDRGIVLAHGPTGIGKTMCAHAIADKFPGTIYIRISQGDGGFHALRRTLTSRLRLVSSRGRARSTAGLTLNQAVFAKLRGSHRLLIIDEAHQLADSAIAFIRDIYDECGIPILLICTKDLLDRIRSQSDEDHGQFYSRLAWVCGLSRKEADGRGDGGASGLVPLFSVKEIRAIYERDKVRLLPDAQAYLLEIANDLGKGSLRRCDVVYDAALKYERQSTGAAPGDPVSICAELLEAMERDLFRDHDMVVDIQTRSRATAAAG